MYEINSSLVQAQRINPADSLKLAADLSVGQHIHHSIGQKVELEMNQSLKIGIIGDFDKGRSSQLKTDEALDHVSKRLSIAINAVWLPTKSLEKRTVTIKLREFHALWAGPGDYENPDGAIKAIRFCREQQWPFFGT